jgi:hypothetical protein
MMGEQLCEIVAAEVNEDGYHAIKDVLVLFQGLNACLQCSLIFIDEPVPSHSYDLTSIYEIIGYLCEQPATP